METMDYWFWVSLGLIAGLSVLIGFSLAMWVWVRRIEHQQDQGFEQLRRNLDSEKLIPLTVELFGDQFLCYNSITQDFVCQGRDFAEIKQKFLQRFPDKSAAIHRGDDHVLDLLKQQISSVTETAQ